MKRKQVDLLKYLALAAFAVCLFSAPTWAQSVASGEFDLPCAAIWGTAVLPAGHYTYNLESVAKQGRLIVRGEGRVATISASDIDDHHFVDRDVLVLTRSGGEAIVRALRLTGFDMTFYYAMPRSARLVAANTPALIQQVPIVRNGK